MAGSVATDTFILTGTNGPAYANYSSNGLASECYVSDCRYRIVTTANHSFLAADPLFIRGASETGAGTSINTAVNNSINGQSPSGSTFYLPGNGNSYRDWTSGGSIAECTSNLCNVEVTSNGHGLATGDYAWVSGVGGLTGISTSGNTSWQVTVLSSSLLRLSDTSPALSNMSGAYTSGGSAQCLVYGCENIRFVNSSNNARVYSATDCLVERYGADAATDAAPATSGLGILYSSNGACTTTNYATPLTSNKTRLHASIDALSAGGMTAGQIGIAWGMVYAVAELQHGVGQRNPEPAAGL